MSFKIKNLTMAIEATKLCGLKDNDIFQTLKKVKDVDGRLELSRRFPNNIKVFIDTKSTTPPRRGNIVYKINQKETITLHSTKT